MSGLEAAIPIATGLVCAVGAMKSLLPSKKNDRGRERYDNRDDRRCRGGRHSKRSRARGRSNSRSSRTLSLSRDTPHSIELRYKSRSRSRWSDSNSERSRSKPSHSRRSRPKRRSSRHRYHHSSSHNGQRHLHSDDRARWLVMPSSYDEAPCLDLCNGRVELIRMECSDGSIIRDIYVCKRCKLEIVESGISSWHRFEAKDRREVRLHKNFILRSHKAREGQFGCMICYKCVTGYKSLVHHLMNHRYAELANVALESEWKGSEDWVPSRPSLVDVFNEGQGGRRVRF